MLRSCRQAQMCNLFQQTEKKWLPSSNYSNYFLDELRHSTKGGPFASAGGQTEGSISGSRVHLKDN